MLSFRRARRHAAVLAAVAAVACVVTAASIGIVGMLAASADDGVRLGLAARSGADLALRASIAIADDAERQDQQVRQAIARTFPRLSPTPEVTRSVAAELDVRSPAAPGEERAGLIASMPDLEQRAVLVDGRWPDDASEVTVQADAAQTLEVRAGDVVTIAGEPVTVVGLWTVADALDPRWLGDPQVLNGRGSRIGPIVIDESLWTTLPDVSAIAQWTIVPDATRITASDLARIPPAWKRITTDWRGQVDELGSVAKGGGLALTAAAMQSRVDGMRAIEPVVLLLVLAAALVTLAELARLLAADRADEIALLWSRGRSSVESAVAGGVESAATAAVGVAVGAGLGLAALAVLGGDPAAAVAPVVGAMLASLVIASGAFGAWGSLRASRPDARSGAAESRTTRVAVPGVAALVAAAAAVSVWQLRLYGSPVTPVADGGSAIDPIAVVAPAVALIAVVLLGLVLFPPVARLIDGAAARASVTRMLAARTVARRLPRVASLVVVVAVASGAIVVAATYTGTWSGAFDRTSALRAGSDVSVVATRGGIDARQLDALDALPSVDAAAPVRAGGMQLTDETGTLVAVSASAFAALATEAGGALDPAAVAARIRADVPALELPADVDSIVAVVDATGFAAPPEVLLHLVDDRGRLLRIAADRPEERPGQLTYSIPIPDAAHGASRVLAVDVLLPEDSVTGDASATFVFRGWQTGDGADLANADDLFWFPSPLGADFSPPVPFGGTGFSADAASRSTRMLPGKSGGPVSSDHPAIAVSRALADRYDLAVGDPFSFGAEGTYTRIDAVVVDVVAAVPGAESGLAALIDLTTMQRTALETADLPATPTGAWIATADPDAVAAAARETLPPNTRIRVAEDPAGRTVVGATAVALGVAAALCGLLALVTLIGVARAERRSRAGDVDVLRALGLSSREQAALRRAEWWSVIVYGGAVGLIAGAAVAALTIPELASAAVPDPYPGVGTDLSVDVVGLLIGTALLGLACAAVVQFAAAQVARRARTLREKEDAR